MSAKLKWSENRLTLGPFCLVRIVRVNTWWETRFPGMYDETEFEIGRWQEKADAVQDTEAEVCRVLRTAGVVVEP